MPREIIFSNEPVKRSARDGSSVNVVGGSWDYVPYTKTTHIEGNTVTVEGAFENYDAGKVLATPGTKITLHVAPNSPVQKDIEQTAKRIAEIASAEEKELNNNEATSTVASGELLVDYSDFN